MKTSNPAFWIVLAAMVAAGAKLYCAATTIGTNDAHYFFLFASMIEKFGLLAVYDHSILYNHTPLVGEMLLAALHISRATDTPFYFWLRLPGIIADFGSVVALLWFRARTGTPPWWALTVFALSPVSFMVTGYHGNVDAILVLFVLLAVCACVAEKPRFSGLLLGVACNIKIVPLLFIPIFFFYWRHRRGLSGFLLCFGGVIALGWGAALTLAPWPFVRNVLSYGGYWGDWGITSALYLTGFPAFQTLGFINLLPVQKWIILFLKISIVSGITFLAWRRRACRPSEIFSTVALAWVIFFVLAPGVGPQYLIWFAPFLLVHAPRWYLALTVICTVFLTVFYTIISHEIPWNFGNSTVALFVLVRPWFVLPWLALTILLAVSVREIFARSAVTPVAPSAA